MTRPKISEARNALKFSLLSNLKEVKTKEGKKLFLKGGGTIYWLKRKIGNGGYGSVWEAVDLSWNPEPLAIKLLDKCHTRGDASNENHIHELMGTSGGKPVLSLFGRNAVVMKLITGRQLETELLDPNSSHSPLDIYRKAKAKLFLLHKKGYFHGDTNTRNFIVDPEGEVFLIDYGETRPIRDLACRIEDIRKLASNVADETQYRGDKDAIFCRREALLDLENPEALIDDISSVHI